MDVARGTVFLRKSGVETEDTPPREFTFDAVYDDKWVFYEIHYTYSEPKIFKHEVFTFVLLRTHKDNICDI